MPQIAQRVLNSWSELTDIAERFDVGDVLKTTYLYRGQRDADWKLEPSLHRAATKGGRIALPATSELLNIERHLTQRFCAVAPIYLPSPVYSSTTTAIDWWPVMRHYGVPTRLLDWTASIYVAAYFAASSAPDKDGAIYVVHADTLDRAMKAAHGEKASFSGSPGDLAMLQSDGAPPVVYFFDRATSKLDRMITQQGVFMGSANAGADVESIMAEKMPLVADPKITALVKLRIRSVDKPKFMRCLRAMNVTGSSLFPGLDEIGLQLTELTQFRD